MLKGMARLTALLGVLLMVAGCADFWVPSERYTIEVGGMERSYRLYQPKGLPSAAPLVVVLHSAGANTVNAEVTYGWDKQADAHKFVVAYPEGIDWTWNAHGCCGRAAEEGVDDIGFITTMIGKIPGIDHSRVYVTGMSNGGMMAYTLACTTDLFLAIGPVAATQVDTCPAPRPTSVMHIHSLGDELVRFGGTAKAGLLLVDAPAVQDVNAFWRRVDSCGPPAVTENPERTTSTAKCPDNREVVLVTLTGGEHEWPKGAESELWKFFAAHRVA